jgi:Domain of unknown function (DUF4156)
MRWPWRKLRAMTPEEEKAREIVLGWIDGTDWNIDDLVDRVAAALTEAAAAGRTALGGILAVLLMSGCVTMSPQAESVRVVYNPLELTAACTSLGEVKSWSGWGGFAAGAGYENAERGLREDTASLGGNTLLALYSRGGDLAGVSSRGQAYRCP